MDILDTLTGAELFAASDRCDESLEQEFMRHVKRVKEALALPDIHGEPCCRAHHNDKNELITASRTYILYDNSLIPLLIGSVVREHNHSLLSVIDRSGSTPVVYESKFDTRYFVAQAA